MFKPTKSGILSRILGADSVGEKRDLVGRNDGKQVLFLTGDGKVGVGITNPGSYYSGAYNFVVGNTLGNGGITIVGGSTNNGRLAFADGTGNYDNIAGGILYDFTNDAISLRTNQDSTRMTITSDGKVGIATATPSAILTVFNNVTSGPNWSQYFTYNSTAQRLLKIGLATGNNSALQARKHDDSEARSLCINPDGGNVGIGTGTPNFQLDLFSSTSDYAFNIFNDGGLVQNRGIKIQCGTDDGSGVIYYIAAHDGDGDVVGGIRNNSGAFELIDLSDERTKTNIEDANFLALDAIKGIKVKTFNRIKIPDGEKITGFIAQDVQQFVPRAVGVSPDDNLLSLSMTALIPVLWKSIQELSSKVDALEARLP